MARIRKLLEGYKRFYQKHFVQNKSLYEKLSVGQNPKTLIIACSDSRVDPTIVTDANAGDIFVVRNVANLVPPYQPDWESYHGTSAALEFAVTRLEVEHIVVMGHSGCAGIGALVDNPPKKDKFNSFILGWMNIAAEARARMEEKCADKDDACRHTVCEKEGILVSLNNLESFPWIAERVAQKKLKLHGWYFSVSDGFLWVYDKESGEYTKADHELVAEVSRAGGRKE